MIEIDSTSLDLKSKVPFKKNTHENEDLHGSSLGNFISAGLSCFRQTCFNFLWLYIEASIGVGLSKQVEQALEIIFTKMWTSGLIILKIVLHSCAFWKKKGEEKQEKSVRAIYFCV